MRPDDLARIPVGRWPQALCVVGHHGWVQAASDERTSVVLYRFPHIGIEQAEELRSATQQRLPEGTHLVSVVVTSALQPGAQNALLKSIEEPAPGHRLVLSVPSLDGVLDTLLSRMVTITNSEPFQLGERSLIPWLKMGTLARIKESEGWLKDKKDPLGRDELRSMLVALEKEVYPLAHKHQSWFKLLDLLVDYRRYLTTSGASAKYLLELLALALPEPK